MPTIVCDCPRCGSAKITFDVNAAIDIEARYYSAQWQTNHEIYGVCRNCQRGTIFVLKLIDYDLINRGWPGDFWQQSIGLNDKFEVIRYISLVDHQKHECPDYVPENIKNAFDEGAACKSIGCHNAAVSMLRLVVDLATKGLLPPAEAENGPTSQQRKVLYHRVLWLNECGEIGDDLVELASCIREDGNDGVHDGSLAEDESTDNLEFADALLRRLFTEPARVQQAKARREARRAQNAPSS